MKSIFSPDLVIIGQAIARKGSRFRVFRTTSWGFGMADLAWGNLPSSKTVIL